MALCNVMSLQLQPLLCASSSCAAAGCHAEISDYPQFYSLKTQVIHFRNEFNKTIAGRRRTLLLKSSCFESNQVRVVHWQLRRKRERGKAPRVHRKTLSKSRYTYQSAKSFQLHDLQQRRASEGEIGSWAARITIDHTSHEYVCNPYFWAGRVYARPWKFREQSREEEQKRDRQPRPTSPTVAGRGPNVAEAGPTTSRDLDIPSQTFRDKEPSKPNDT